METGASNIRRGADDLNHLRIDYVVLRADWSLQKHDRNVESVLVISGAGDLELSTTYATGMTRVWVVAALLGAGLPTSAGAQVTAGGTFMFTVQRTPAGVAGIFSPAPGGAAAGVAVFGGIEVSRRIGIQGELSIPASMSTTGVSSYSTGDFTDTTRHRDVIISALVRLGTERRWCDLLAGVGVVVTNTSGTSVLVYRGSGYVSTVRKELATTRLALTFGGDFPIRLHRHISLLPTGRLHWMSRGPEAQPPFDPTRPFNESRPIGRPASVALRGGIGARVEF